MKLQKNLSLLPYNTFGIDVKTEQLISVHDVEGIAAIFKEIKKEPFFVLGGGSNILFTQDFSGVIIKNEILGIELIKETEDEVFLKVGAGENWHSFVLHCLSKGFYGIENLSLIPGTVGASPIQNIGAYGVEVKDVITAVDFYSISSDEWLTYDNTQCQFGYRDSIFKKEKKGDILVSHVTFKLSKNAEVSVKYGAITTTLEEMKVTHPTPEDVSKAVIKIRQSKLPDPAEIGNGGSFFKNPIIPLEQFNALKIKHPSIVSYPVNPEQVKVPAGWLIDKAGWKGKTYGEIGVHKNQALVLVNYGGGSGKEIHLLAQKIIADIKEKYGIVLVPEINIL